MRYIIFSDAEGALHPLLFPGGVSFARVRDCMPWPTVLSAGQVCLRGGDVMCSGDGATWDELGVRARRKDDALILEQLMERPSEQNT